MYVFMSIFLWTSRMSIPDMVPTVLPSAELRDQLPSVLRRFRVEHEAAAPVIFGSHRKAEAVIIPFELYTRLLPLIEDLEIARLVRERQNAGSSVSHASGWSIASRPMRSQPWRSRPSPSESDRGSRHISKLRHD
jgi:hypothetical protein